MEAVNIFPELMAWRPNKKGLVSITIRFDFNRKRAGNESLHQQIRPQDWDPVAKKVKPSCTEHELLNLLIENTINTHKNYFLRRQVFKLPVNAELIKKYIQCGSLESFYEYAEQVLETKMLKDGLPYDKDTKRRYRDEIKRLSIYKPSLNFQDLTAKFLSEYKQWMQTVYTKKDETRLQPNSIWKAFAFIRMVYNQAIKDEIILADNNPFKQFNVGGYEENLEKIKYVEKEDLDAFENLLQQPGSGLQELTQRIGWRFLAMCVSGLRISDAMLLDDAFFNDAGDLEFKPYKTRRYGNKAQVPIISERQKFYLAKTISLPLPKTEAKSFRTTFNIHLQILAARAGINVHLTSHVGRHTMGSFLVDAGIETKAAKAILGVKKDRVLETYMHLKENKLKQEAMKLKNVF